MLITENFEIMKKKVYNQPTVETVALLGGLTMQSTSSGLGINSGSPIPDGSGGD